MGIGEGEHPRLRRRMLRTSRGKRETQNLPHPVPVMELEDGEPMNRVKMHRLTVAVPKRKTRIGQEATFTFGQRVAEVETVVRGMVSEGREEHVLREVVVPNHECGGCATQQVEMISMYVCLHINKRLIKSSTTANSNVCLRDTNLNMPTVYPPASGCGEMHKVDLLKARQWYPWIGLALVRTPALVVTTSGSLKIPYSTRYHVPEDVRYSDIRSCSSIPPGTRRDILPRVRQDPFIRRFDTEECQFSVCQINVVTLDDIANEVHLVSESRRPATSS